MLTQAFINTTMRHVHYWFTLPLEDAKTAIIEYMDADVIYSQLDYTLVMLGESTEAIVSELFGI